MKKQFRSLVSAMEGMCLEYVILISHTCTAVMLVATVLLYAFDSTDWAFLVGLGAMFSLTAGFFLKAILNAQISSS